MKKTVIKDTKVYFKGNSQVILEGTVYEADAEIVKQNPKLFIDVEVEKAPEVIKEVQTPKEIKVEVPEVIETEEKPKRGRRKTKED